MDERARTAQCECGTLKRLSALADSVVKFDADTNAYFLQYGSTKLHCYHCIACGGLLPKTRIEEDFFLKPDQEEIEKTNRRLFGVKTLDEVISLLGPPDKRIERSSQDEKDELVYNVQAIRETILYTNLPTFNLCVQETISGKICLSFILKAIVKRNGVSPNDPV